MKTETSAAQIASCGGVLNGGINAIFSYGPVNLAALNGIVAAVSDDIGRALVSLVRMAMAAAPG